MPWEEVAGTIYIECRPVPLNRAEIQTAFVNLVGTDPALGGRMDLTIRFLVTRTGRVLYGRITEGRASEPMRAAVLQLIRQYAFRPASVDGRLVNVWVAQRFSTQ